MKKYLLTIIAILIIANAFTANINAQQFTSEDDGFSVWFPSKPKFEILTASDGRPIRMYSMVNRTASFSVAVKLLLHEVTNEQKSVLFDDMRDQILFNPDYKIISEKEVVVSNQIGRETEISGKRINSLDQSFIVKDKIYVIRAVGNSTTLKSEMVKRFFNSFAINDSSASKDADYKAETNEILEKGVIALDAEKYDEAIRFLSQAIEREPEDPGPYYTRGLAYLKSGLKSGRYALEPLLAIADFTESISLTKPDKVDQLALLLFHRCAAYGINGRADLGIADCNKSILLEQTDWRPYYHRGNIYFNQNKISLALEDYSKAIYLKPDIVELYRLRADCYDKLGQKEAARLDREMAKSLANEPK